MKTHNLTVYFIIIASCIATNAFTLAFQLQYHDLPCPLCLLQRFGLLAVAYGATMALRTDGTARYVFVVVISSIFTLIVALRQLLLHIMPLDLGYGPTLFGLHYYTWTALLALAFIIIVAMAPLISTIDIKHYLSNKSIQRLKEFTYYFFILLCFINIVTTFLECGFTACPSNPTEYAKLSKVKMDSYSNTVKQC